MLGVFFPSAIEPPQKKSIIGFQNEIATTHLSIDLFPVTFHGFIANVWSNDDVR